jgi:amidohydrolase
MGFLYSSAWAQSTAIEKKDATKTGEKIKHFRKSERPMEVAEKMANTSDPDRKAVVNRAAQFWDNHMQSLSDWITKHPESGFKEFKAVDTLTTIIKKHGFSVEVGVAGLKTAFVGEYDSPAGTKGPNLGIIVEYDALRLPNGGAYHGDQHSAQGPDGISAAVAITEYMKKESIPGKVYIYGTPAEEMGPPSKRIMYNKGIFDDADILVRSHSSQDWSRSRAGFGVCCLNIDMARYHFLGRVSHQLSSWYGRNALEAATMFYTGVDKIRSSLRPQFSIVGTIPEGGVAPNNVPDSAVVDYYIRYPDGVYLKHIKKMVDNVAKAAAQATGTKVIIENYGKYRDGLSLSTLEELKFAYEQKYAKKPSKVDTVLKRPVGYEETGIVARNIPGVGVSLASSTSPNHTEGMLHDALKPIGHRGFRIGAEVMTAILYDYLKNADFRKLVDKEFKMLQSGFNNYLNNLQKAYKSEENVQLDY